MYRKQQLMQLQLEKLEDSLLTKQNTREQLVNMGTHACLYLEIQQYIVIQYILFKSLHFVTILVSIFILINI